MTTRQVYSTTAYNRVRRNYPVNPTTPRINYPDNYDSPAHVGPTTQQLRQLRLDQFQTKYEQDKEVHKAKEEERQRKKRAEKLKRYEGIGELGNRLSDERPTEGEKCLGFDKSRDNFQVQYENDANIAAQEKIKRDEEKKKKALEEQAKVTAAQDGNPSFGNKLGGNSVERVRGDHPLLKQLQKS